MSAEDLPIAVVGAGLSGLSAAKVLHQNGQKVIVLEASDRVGGRTYTKNTKATSYVDMGGSYVCVGQDRIHELIDELKLETYQVYNTGKSVLISEEGSKYYYKNGDPILSLANPILSMDLYNYLRRFNEDCLEIDVEEPWNSPNATKLDNITMKEYIEKICWTKTVRGAANAFVAFNVCAEGHEVSALYFLWFIKQRGGINRMFSNANQASKIIGGSQLLSTKMADLIEGRVHYNKTVISIKQIEDQVLLITKDGTEYRAKRVILAIPPSQQRGVYFEPDLPGFKNQLNQRMPMGTVIKAIIYYEKSFWRNKGFNGNIVSTSQNKTKRPLAYTLDDSKPDGSYPAIIGFMVGDIARNLAEMTLEDRKCIVAKSLMEIFDSKEALEPIHYEEYDWMENPFTGGCYVGFCFPGVLSSYGRELQKPIGRLYFAGTETSTKWAGYMDGAIRSGQRSARQVLSDMGITVPDTSVKGFKPMKKTFIELNLPSINQMLSLITVGVAILMAYTVW